MSMVIVIILSGVRVLLWCVALSWCVVLSWSQGINCNGLIRLWVVLR
jgi:hypothetical protein